MSCHPSSRREILAMLGAGALIPRVARSAEAGLQFVAVDHLGITVSDPGQSAAFYARIFGGAVYKNNKTTQRYVKLGPAYISIRPAGRQSKGYGVDHICPGVAAFDLSTVQATLKSLGVRAREVAGFGMFAEDPDGTEFQLWTADSWSESVKTASPESYPDAGEPIFTPTGIDHILLNVTDLGGSVAFYEKLFGPVTRRGNNRTWFQAGKSQIGLLPVAGGRKPGVNHFCVAAASFEYQAAVKRLAGAGAKVESTEVSGAPEFRDPDGILVQVMAPRTLTNR
ncbi:MAG TPA: VOC family protein [Bryobacteraceae bacterium]|nr:VOC family protein [Bryobacteraceae bacterium]